MDHLDTEILMLIQGNAKLNTKEIAGKIGLSVTPTYERIKKLENRGIIKSYVALLNRRKIGKHLVAFCQITLQKHKKTIIENFKKRVAEFPEIMEINHVSGNYDFLLKVVVADIDEFHLFVNEKLSVVDGISTINSSFVMDNIKEETQFQL
ncbi:MAG: Lrp/AsnC family leucine-responsive transcriptional regulator [Flavobacteriales bacterium]|jgi:Lrp/AsnC family leucine-responsive transcriptional regulator